MKDFNAIYNEITAEWLKSNPIQCIVDKLELSDRKSVVLYGAGRLAKVYKEAMESLNITVTAVCDKKTKGQIEELDIITPDTLKTLFLDSMILVCSYSYNEQICNELKEWGFLESQIIPCPNQWPYFESPKSFSKYVEGYKWAYEFFEDEKSKKLVEAKLRLYLLDEQLVPDTDSDCYYEKDVIKLGTDEVYVDGGAFNGDSTLDFIEKTNGSYKHVFCLEPSSVNFKVTTDKLKQNDNVDVINKGLWSSEEKLQFFFDETNPAGSCLINASNRAIDDENTIYVTSIDCLAKAKNIYPTYIKMDIEGSEKEALIGARNTILKTKPQLAICAYHKVEDVYELPQTILNIRNDYKFVLRQHMYGCFDTVLYAY